MRPSALERIAPKHSQTPLLLLLAAIGVFYALTLRAGHDWRDDFGLYLLHAENLVSSRPYADTGYLFNPLEPHLGPAAYPPVFPALLAPVLAIFGLRLIAFKLEILLLFLAGIYFMTRLFERHIPPAAAWAIATFVGFNPVFWDFRNQIYSDLPFLALCYLTLYLMQKAEDSAARLSSYKDGIAIGIASYLAYGTRVHGVTLIAAFFISELAQGRWKSYRLWTAISVFCLTAIAQAWLIPGTNTYALEAQEYFGRSPLVPLLAEQIILYTRLLAKFWENMLSIPALVAFTALLSALALRGYWSRSRQSGKSMEIFGLLYGLACILTPTREGLRYLFPLIPLFLYYAYVGVQSLQFLRPKTRTITVLGVSILLLISYISKYSGLYLQGRFGPIAEGVEKPESQALFAFVKEKTAPDSVFIFRRPRALALYTHRHVSILPLDRSDGVVWSYLKDIHADYLIAGSIFPEDRLFIQPFVSRNASHFHSVYSNPDFTVYRIAP